MTAIERYLRQNHFNTLANLRIAAALRDSGRSCEEERTMLSHILHAEKLWLLQLEGFDTRSIQLQSAMTVNECTDLAQLNEDAMRSYLQRLNGDTLEEPIQYQRLNGDVHSNTIDDILTHIFFHSAYHRAQINRLLREAGDSPAQVDFIGFARGGWEAPSA